MYLRDELCMLFLLIDSLSELEILHCNSCLYVKEKPQKIFECIENCCGRMHKVRWLGPRVSRFEIRGSRFPSDLSCFSLDIDQFSFIITHLILTSSLYHYTLDIDQFSLPLHT